MAAPVFGVFFVGVTPPITDQAFLRVDATHWVFEVTGSVAQDYRKLQEVSLFLMQPVDPSAALGLYISVGGAEWQYRGFVSNSHPSGDLMQKEGSKLAGRQEFAKRVAMDLYRFMESFNVGQSGSQLVLPTDILDKWLQKFDHKFRKDPDFLMHVGQKT